MELRPYQTEAIENIRSELRAGRKRIILRADVGTGKTVVAADIIRSATGKGGHVLFLAHMRDLVSQASKKLTKVGVRHSVIMGGYPHQTSFDRVHVGTIQSFKARVKAGRFPVEDVRVVICDEAHLSLSDGWADFLGLFPKAVVVGLTATPMRTDGRGLASFYQALVNVMSYEEAVEKGYLLPIRYFVPSQPDLKGVRTTAGDYNSADLEKKQNTPKLTGEIVSHWKRLGENRLTICFGITVRHSLALRDAFLTSGIAACHIDGETPHDERESLLRAFERGEYRVLCNVGIAVAGLDIPEVSCVIQAFATKSSVKHIQTIGRGSRPFPGQKDLIVLDHGGNTQRLGRVEDFTEWRLEESKGANDAKEKTTEGKEIKEGASLTCQNCGTSFSGAILCPTCGALYDIRKAPQEVLVQPGELEELRRKQEVVSMERKNMEFAMILHLTTEHYRKKGERDEGKAGKYASRIYKERHGVWPVKTHKVIPVVPDEVIREVWRKKTASNAIRQSYRR